jgi:hypothetical protein
MGLSLRQVSEAEWEAWVARSEGLAQQEERPEATEASGTDKIEPAAEEATASGQGQQSEAGVEHTPAPEPGAAAQIEDATSASDPVEKELPGGQFVEEPVPLSESLWTSFVEEGQLVTERNS